MLHRKDVSWTRCTHGWPLRVLWRNHLPLSLSRALFILRGGNLESRLACYAYQSSAGLLSFLPGHGTFPSSHWHLPGLTNVLTLNDEDECLAVNITLDECVQTRPHSCVLGRLLQLCLWASTCVAHVEHVRMQSLGLSLHSVLICMHWPVYIQGALWRLQMDYLDHTLFIK